MKKSNLKHTLIIGLIALLSIGFITILFKGLEIDPNNFETPLMNKKAPDISFISVEDPEKTLKLSDFTLEQPIILNFWASWCISCKTEASQLELAHQHIKEAKVIGIAIQDELEMAAGFAKKYGKTYLLGLDETGYANTSYGIRGVPETFIIDKQGIVVKHIVGPADFNQLRAEINRINQKS